jgi:tetratricopeptide (TPR) repeat protein
VDLGGAPRSAGSAEEERVDAAGVVKEVRGLREEPSDRDALDRVLTVELPAWLGSEESEVCLRRLLILLAKMHDEHGRYGEAANRPPHQPALVWQVYCRRLRGEPPEHLLPHIHALLHGSGGSESAKVVNADLRAALLSQHAALIEAGNPARARRYYEQALKRRPRMPFALRGAIQCRHISGDARGARALAGELLERDEHSDTQDRLAADVLVEIGQLRVAERDFEGALTLLHRAIERLPTYGFAYGRAAAALRTKGETREAVRFAERTIGAQEHLLAGVGSLRIELGHSYLAADRVNSAIAEFRATEEDAYIVLGDRARAGLIQALLWKRDLARARHEVTTRRRGPGCGRLEDAAGWFHGTVGAYSKALSHFKRAAEERPYEPSPIVGQARVLRLLGRPAAARRLLDERAERWPQHNASLLHSEAGWAAIDERCYTDALCAFERVLDFNPKHLAALRGRIVAAVRAEHGSHAIWGYIDSALEQIGAGAPGRPSLLTEIGAELLVRGDGAAARRMFAEANALSTSISQRLIQGHALLRVHALGEAQACAGEAERLAAEAAGGAIDVRPIGWELSLLADELIQGREDAAVLSVDFEQLLRALSSTDNGAAAAERLRELWAKLGDGAAAADATPSAIRRAMLDRLDGLRELEAQAVGPLPRDPDILMLEGACHLEARAYWQAARAFGEAAEVFGAGAVPSALAKALVLMEQQEYGAACECLLLLAEGEGGEARDEQGSIRARELLAWSLLHLEQQGDPPKNTLRSRLARSRLAGFGTRLRGGRESHSARIVDLCLNKIVAAEPSRVDAYICLGVLAMHEQRPAKALSYLQQAIDAGPKLAHPLREKAALLLRMGDYARASVHIAQALAIDPHDSRTHLLEGLIALEQDQPQAAVAALKQAHELDPNDHQAALGFATALRHTGHEEDAIDVLTGTLKRVPPERSVMLLLARAATQHALAKTRADLPPEASLSSALKDAKVAADRARTARERAEAEYHRGVILFARDRHRAATRALHAALGQNPNHLRARHALAAIQESKREDPHQRLVSGAAYLTIGLAVVLFVGILVQSFVIAHKQGAHLPLDPGGVSRARPAGHDRLRGSSSPDRQSAAARLRDDHRRAVLGARAVADGPGLRTPTALHAMGPQHLSGHRHRDRHGWASRMVTLARRVARLCGSRRGQGPQLLGSAAATGWARASVLADAGASVAGGSTVVLVGVSVMALAGGESVAGRSTAVFAGSCQLRRNSSLAATSRGLAKKKPCPLSHCSSRRRVSSCGCSIPSASVSIERALPSCTRLWMRVSPSWLCASPVMNERSIFSASTGNRCR